MSKLKFLSRFTPDTFPSEKIHPLIDESLDDEEYSVRATANNSNATKDHLDKALDDDHRYVRATTAKNPRYKEYYPSGHK